jgi:Brp/Blh family beta-carotene 15,15'-monooxygenase
MNLPNFAWVPLAPPEASVEPPPWVYRWALLAALVAGLGGLIQVSLGLTAGLAALLPIAMSALLFGMPHGAIDHLVAIGLLRQRLTLSVLAAVAGAYVAIAVVYGLVWVVAPGAALVFFLIITVIHWGHADAAFARITHPRSLLRDSPALYRCHAILRGLLPVGLPLVAFPQESQQFLESCTQLVGVSAPELGLARTALLYTIAGLVLVENCWLIYRQIRGRGADAWRLLTETVLLLVFFSLVPPLIAIGWYFCLWHGLRHVLRLMRYAPPEDASGRRCSLDPAVRLFFRRAAPFTLVPLLCLGGLGLMLSSQAEPESWLALYLVLISTLTLPHMILVAWMDRTELAASPNRG